MDCWHHEIDKATTEREIVRNASDYLVLWAPKELEPINLGLTDLRIETPDDIERVKRWLGDNRLKPNAGSRDSAHVQELAHYFSHAAARLGELRKGLTHVRPMA